MHFDKFSFWYKFERKFALQSLFIGSTLLLAYWLFVIIIIVVVAVTVVVLQLFYICAFIGNSIYKLQTTNRQITDRQATLTDEEQSSFGLLIENYCSCLSCACACSL